MKIPTRQAIRETLREHEAVHPLTSDPDTIHCLCGMWFDDFWQWIDHVSPLVEAAVADPATIRAIRARPCSPNSRKPTDRPKGSTP